MAFPSWFEDKFGPHTPELYQEEVRRTPRQLAALRKLLGKPQALRAPLLDLCCGWGRHALPLARMGYPVVALDGCRWFLERLRADAARLGGPQPLAVRGDMRQLPLADRSVAAAVQLYTSFGYGTDPEDDRRALVELARVLLPGGLYLLDLINWSLARRAFDGRFEEQYEGFDLVEEGRIEPGSELLRMKRSILWHDDRPTHTYQFEIRMFDRPRLTRLLEAAGLAVREVWGEFDGRPYDSDRSYRMIMLCGKEG